LVAAAGALPYIRGRGPWKAALAGAGLLASTALIAPAAAFLPLAVVTAGALVVLGWRRGGYLFVPALWPLNATGYSVVSMPVLGAMPFVAAAISIPVPYLAPVVIIATALVTLRRHDRSAASLLQIRRAR